MSEGHYERLALQKIDDAVYGDLRNKTWKDKGLAKKIRQSGRRPFRVVAVCLGVCLILLGVNIAQAVHFNNNLTQLKNEVKQLKCQIAESCPSGWKKFGSSCYYRTEYTTWLEGREYCLKQGADLVVINSREEQVFIRGLNPGVYASWIGLNRTEGRWTWVDGTPLTTQYWRSGYPLNDEDRNCAVYRHWTDPGTWINTLCSSTRASICEK